jgi:hypothetical protein
LALAFHLRFFLPYGLWRIEMNEDDLRDCFAMFASTKFAKESDMDLSAKFCYAFADNMLEARKHKERLNEEDSGIAAVVPKRSRKR